MNQYAGKTGSGYQGAMRQWLSQENIQIGDTISVLAALEVFKDKQGDKIQLNIHKMRVIRNSGEEMLQFQQTLLAQRVFFEPKEAFQRRLFDKQPNQTGSIQKPAY